MLFLGDGVWISRMSRAVIHLSAFITACSTILRPSKCFCCRLSVWEVQLSLFWVTVTNQTDWWWPDCRWTSSFCSTETQAEPSLQATQLRLKRARLANDLNEKIAQRPGPMELVEKKILPVDSGVEEVINSKRSLALLTQWQPKHKLKSGSLSDSLSSTSVVQA